MSTSKAPETGDDRLSPSMQNLLQKLLEQELKRPAQNTEAPHSNALLARLEGFDEVGYPVVVYHHQGVQHKHSARSTIELKREDAGRECLIHLCGDPDSPVIAGLIQPPLRETAPGNTAIIRTDEGIRLQSGDAYIELTAEGTVRIRGDYVESVAYGANRLKGASVKIN
jgi:hypothetical protein